MKGRGLLTWAALLAAAPCGCVVMPGTCPDPLEPIELNGVFGMAVAVDWAGNTIELTAQAQPDVGAFYAEHSGNEVWPFYYLSERLFDLGSMRAGELLEVEFLSHIVSKAELYDGEFTRLGFGEAHDFEGNRRVLQVPIMRQSNAFFLRVLLAYLPEDGNPIVRLTRTTMDDTPERRPQSVVLDFSGQTGVVYRWGNLVPTDVAPLEDFAAREVAIQTFEELFAAYNLTVFSDTDPTPGEPFSIIYVGAASPTLRGEALANSEWSDGLNQFQDDIAVVDINSLASTWAGFSGSAVLGKLIGRTAAHEMGHLLGLTHVRDPSALMSGLGCVPFLDSLEQRFKRAQLYWRHDPYDPYDTEHWVLGYQDSMRYLMDVLGPAEEGTPGT